MSGYDELDELDETTDNNKMEEGKDLKADGKEKDMGEMDGNDAEVSKVGDRLGESDEDYYRKQQAEAEAKGEYTYAEQYKEQADAAAIYNEIK
jgi:hypothetical protein